jgi:hypothetical protein
MAKYEVAGQNGEVFEIEGPDDADPSQIIAQVTGGAQAASSPVTRESLLLSNPGEYDANSPEFKERNSPTAGNSFLQNAAAGAGKAIVDMGRGIRQLGTEAVDRVAPRQGISRGDVLRQEQGVNASNDAALMRTGGGLVGNVGGNIAGVLLPGAAIARGAQVAARGAQALNMGRAGVVLGRTGAATRAFMNPATYKAAAASGAALGALQPVGEEDSRTGNVALGALAGGAGNAIANTAGRIAQPLKARMQSKATKTLEAAGVPLDAAQRTGSPLLARMGSALSDNPATINQRAAFQAKQQAAFNRAALKEIGETSDAATQDVMASAKKRIGSYFDEVAERVSLKIDRRLGNDVQGIIERARNAGLPENEVAGLERVMGRVQKHGEGGALTGEQYQQIKQSLDDISAGGELSGELGRQLRSRFDAALERSSAGTPDFKLLKDARRQWQALKQIEQAIDKDGAGNISPARLANVYGQKANRSQGVYGGGNQRLVRLAQAGKQVLTDKTPNSGTAARLAAQLTPSLALGGVVGVGTGFSTGDFQTGLSAAALTAAPFAGARLGQNLLTGRGARYLTEGMRPGIRRNALTKAAGSAVTRQLPNALLAAQQ